MFKNNRKCKYIFYVSSKQFDTLRVNFSFPCCRYSGAFLRTMYEPSVNYTNTRRRNHCLALTQVWLARCWNESAAISSSCHLCSLLRKISCQPLVPKRHLFRPPSGHENGLFVVLLRVIIILMALCKTAVSPLLMQWRYRSHALSHRYHLLLLFIAMVVTGAWVRRSVDVKDMSMA